MSGYIYWHYANTYFFGLLIGWMARGKGLALYLLLALSPFYAFHALPVMVAQQYFGMTTVYGWEESVGYPVFIGLLGGGRRTFIWQQRMIARLKEIQYESFLINTDKA